MSNFIVPNTFVPGTKAKAQEVNENFAAIQEELNDKAGKNGDASQTFLVANATQNNEAVNKGQLNSAISTSINNVVTHTVETEEGTLSRPVYVTSEGVATACTGIDTSNLCATSYSDVSATKPAVVKESKVNGSSWYRVWSDGWIEQGGRKTSSSPTSISLTKNFSNTNYCVIANGYNQTGSGYLTVSYGGAYDIAANGFTLQASSQYKNVIWYACGY